MSTVPSNTPTGGQSVAADLLHGYSLEMTARDTAALDAASAHIPARARIHLTALENESLQDRQRAARQIRAHCFRPVPHLAARRLRSHSELRETLSAFEDVGAADEVFLVGGDPHTPHGPFPDALSLIDSGALAEHGVREVGITGYPDGHPSIDRPRLHRALTDKLAALDAAGLQPFIVTQFTFNADQVAAWVATLRAANIDVPLRIGAPGPAGAKRLLGFARRLGIATNAGMLRKYGLSLTNLVGNSTPEAFIAKTAQALGKYELGDVGLHFYTFGGLEAAATWLEGHLDSLAITDPRTGQEQG